MSKQTHKRFNDVEVIKVVPAEVKELKRGPRSNQTLVSMLKSKYDHKREVLFYCECSQEPTLCKCDNQMITVEFVSDLYLKKKDVITIVLPIPSPPVYEPAPAPYFPQVVYMPSPPYYCKCYQPSEKCFQQTCTNFTYCKCYQPSDKCFRHVRTCRIFPLNKSPL